MSAYQKLSAIQVSLNAPKNQLNNFGGYNYRSCEDILQAVKPLLDGGVILISDEIKLIGDRYYVEATAKYIFGNEVIENKAYAREPVAKKGMDESQITGATSSYARKYALNGLLLIDDNKDADTMDNRDSTVKTLKSVKDPSLAQIMSEGDDVVTAQYWRSLTQDRQQSEWKTLDKESQKYLKELIRSTPARESA